jgi:hypothetical protein
MSTMPGIQVEEELSDGVRLPKEPPPRLTESPTLTGAYTIVLHPKN